MTIWVDGEDDYRVLFVTVPKGCAGITYAGVAMTLFEQNQYFETWYLVNPPQPSPSPLGEHHEQ